MCEDFTKDEIVTIGDALSAALDMGAPGLFPDELKALIRKIDAILDGSFYEWPCPVCGAVNHREC